MLSEAPKPVFNVAEMRKQYVLKAIYVIYDTEKISNVTMFE